MKRLGTIAVIAALLLATALFYRFRAEEEVPVEPEQVTTQEKEAPPTGKPSDDGPEPVTEAMAAGTLTLEAGTSHGYLGSGSVHDLYAAIDIAAEEIEGGTRPPLNLAVVIDRSGSMSGDKMNHAKRAAMRLVDSLQPRDRLAIISYASGVSVDVSSTEATRAAKARMHAAIQQIYASGGTNIGAGYTRGFHEVERWKDAESINRVVLMSDGKATVGVTSDAGLTGMARSNLQQGVSLTTMGVGLDYNEDLMAAMAGEGAGNYYFIDEPETVVSMLESEFDGLSKTVARNTSLVISLADGVELVELFGFSYRQTNRQVMVPLAEVRSGENKNILLKLQAQTAEAGLRPIMDVDLSYHDVTDDGAKNQRVALASVSTDDVDEARSKVKVEVISRVQQVEVAESLKEAMAAYERGERQQAQQELERRRSSLRKARKRYKLDHDSFDKAEAELSQTANELKTYEASSSSGKRMIKSKKARGRMILLDSSKF